MVRIAGSLCVAPSIADAVAMLSRGSLESQPCCCPSHYLCGDPCGSVSDADGGSLHHAVLCGNFLNLHYLIGTPPLPDPPHHAKVQEPPVQVDSETFHAQKERGTLGSKSTVVDMGSSSLLE